VLLIKLVFKEVDTQENSNHENENEETDNNANVSNNVPKAFKIENT